MSACHVPILLLVWQEDEHVERPIQGTSGARATGASEDSRSSPCGPCTCLGTTGGPGTVFFGKVRASRLYVSLILLFLLSPRSPHLPPSCLSPVLFSMMMTRPPSAYANPAMRKTRLPDAVFNHLSGHMPSCCSFMPEDMPNRSCHGVCLTIRQQICQYICHACQFICR